MQQNVLRSFIHLSPEHLGCICVGPTQNKGTVDKIKEQLVNMGYKDVPVYYSKIPYVEH